MCEGTPGWCDFETKLCDDWHQEKDDVFDWRWIGGATNTASTGPSADHTTRLSTGKSYQIMVQIFSQRYQFGAMYH